MRTSSLIGPDGLARPMTDPGRWLSYPDAPRLVGVPPGPRSLEMLERQRSWETEAVVYSRYFPIGLAEGRGATVEDVDGNRFIDWVAGVSVLNLGHRHPRVQAALQRQVERLWHALEIPTQARLEFLGELRGILPGSLRDRARALFTVTGGDAVETAVSLAGYVTGRPGTVAFSGAYHGVHGGAVNLTSGRKYRATSAFHGAQVVRIPYPNPYRPILGDGTSAAPVLEYLEALARDPYSGIDELGAVLVEPVLGEGGYVLPPPDFLPGLREFCDRHDLLLIVDEVQTGLGRTGAMWACEAAGVTPDVLCIGKSIGGGLPLSVVVYRPDLPRALPPGFHLGTYRGNPLALAAGTEVIRELRDGPWVERARHLGPRLLARFREVAARHPSIGDARGSGFMIGIELTRDPARREPWAERAAAARHEMFVRGLLMHTCGAFDNVLRFMAPLVIEDELLDRGVEIFAAAFAALDAAADPGGHRRGAGPAGAPHGLGPAPAFLPPAHPPAVPAPPGRTL